jgi:chromosome segregation ATPase
MKRTLGIAGMILVVALAIGTIATVPAVRADEAGTVVAAADNPAVTAKIATLKGIRTQIQATVQTIKAKVEAARTAGKDLTPFKAELRKLAVNVRQVTRRLERVQINRDELKALADQIRALRTQIQEKKKAGAPEAEITALRKQVNELLKQHPNLARMMRNRRPGTIETRLDNAILLAQKHLATLQDLLARLP